MLDPVDRSKAAVVCPACSARELAKADLAEVLIVTTMVDQLGRWTVIVRDASDRAASVGKGATRDRALFSALHGLGLLE